MADTTNQPTEGSPARSWWSSKVTVLQHILTTRNARCGQIPAVCAVLSATALFTAIVGFGLYISKHRIALVNTGTPFCCPEEAAEMARNANANVNPCNDFSAYVCANRTRGSSELPRTWWKKLVVTGVLPEGAQMGSAAIFLIAYHRSCVEVITRQELFFSDLALGIVGAMREVLSTPDSRNVLAYALTMASKYNLPSLISAIFYEPFSLLLFHTFLWCQPTPFSLLALEASALAVRSVLNMTVTEVKATTLMESLCTRFPRTNISGSAIYSLDDLFNKNVWSVEDLKAGLEMLGYRATNDTKVHVEEASVIRALYEVFAAPEKDIENGLKAVLLVWKSLQYSQLQFRIWSHVTPPFAFRSCERSLDEMKELTDLLIVQLLVHENNEAKATSVFTRIKDTVYEDCRSSFLFEPEDYSRLKTFFRRMSLLSPKQDVELLAGFPKPDRLFAVNLLRGREYNSAVLQKRVRSLELFNGFSHKSLQYSRGQQVLFVPPQISAKAVAGTSFRSELLSMTILGRLIAESIWYAVLSDSAWGSKTVANIKRFLDCFVFNYTTHDEDARTRKRSSDHRVDERYALAFDALGLASVLRAIRGADWHTVKHAWSLKYLSHGQLFYFLTTFDRCPVEWSPLEGRLINAPLQEQEDFARTFNCSPEAPMAPANRCMLQAAHPLDG